MALETVFMSIFHLVRTDSEGKKDSCSHKIKNQGG